MLKRLAVIRKDNVRECPFGLPIVVGCMYAGEAIDRMTAKDEVEEHKWLQTKKANRRIYRHYKTSERCPFADKIAVKIKAVHCDRGEGGERMRDFPMRPSPFYPRVFSGLGNTGLWSYPVDYYWDNSGARSIFNGVYSIYAATGEINIQKHSITPDSVLTNLVSNSDLEDPKETRWAKSDPKFAMDLMDELRELGYTIHGRVAKGGSVEIIQLYFMQHMGISLTLHNPKPPSTWDLSSDAMAINYEKYSKYFEAYKNNFGEVKSYDPLPFQSTLPIEYRFTVDDSSGIVTRDQFEKLADFIDSKLSGREKNEAPLNDSQIDWFDQYYGLSDNPFFEKEEEEESYFSEEVPNIAIKDE